MNAFARCVTVAGVGTFLCVSLAGPATAAEPGVVSCKPISHVQRRVVEKADQGMQPLRQYVTITRSIHQLDMMEVAESLDAWRASARCLKQAEESAAQPVGVATSAQ
jgi:hypothetical protein